MTMKTLRPAALAWLVTSLLLLAATLHSVLTRGELGTAGMIFLASVAVYFFAYLLLRDNG